MIGSPAAGAQSTTSSASSSSARGIETVREGARELTLSAGDIVLWDGLQPTEVEIVEAFYKRTLLFPRERVLPSARGSPS